MNIRTLCLDVDAFRDTGRVFPEDIEKDGWVVFHGTCEANAKSIEQHGFRPTAVPVSSDDVEAVLTVFEQMKWEGADPAGLTILRAFARGDFDGEARSPVFFADNAAGALLYATREYAGGEKLRGLRIAIRDLQRYLGDEEVRAQHQADVVRDILWLKERYGSDAVPVEWRPPSVDLEWLGMSVRALEGLSTRAVEWYERHGGGVVYAVRFTEQDVVQLGLKGGQGGLRTRAKVPPEHIVSKVSVPAQFVIDDVASIHSVERLQKGGGLFQAIQRAHSGVRRV